MEAAAIPEDAEILLMDANHLKGINTTEPALESALEELSTPTTRGRTGLAYLLAPRSPRADAIATTLTN